MHRPMPSTRRPPLLVPEMDDEQFGQWTKLLEQRTGMVLPQARKSFLVTSLGLRMQELGCASYREYFDRVKDGPCGLVEWSTLVDRLTVHETRFFRHPASMDLVREKVLSKVEGAGTETPSVQIWSAGCATGEEPYTLAMVVDDVLRSRNTQAYFGIVATDISQPSLEAGRTAVYNIRRIKNVPPEFFDRYLVSVGRDRYQVHEQLRKRICFARMNIVDSRRAPLGKMDIIYCQNLLIYFDRARRESIISAMADRLHPGGLLILGSGELVGWKHPAMERVKCGQTLAYRRVEAGVAER